MHDDPFVLVITGPAGSGKSTVAKLLAKQIDNCVNIEVDHVKHMIPSGFYKDEGKPGGWGFDQWALVGDSIGLLAANFLEKGYSVVINGYLDEAAWDSLEKQVKINHKILLLPSLEKAVERDDERTEDVKMGKAAVVDHHGYFSSSILFKNFTRIDNSNITELETLQKIKNIL